MKIAVCDDEKAFNAKTIKIITSILPDPTECEIFTCLSGEELLTLHSENPVDIIFLDIEMGEKNGLEIAREIRKSDDKVIITFLTNYDEFAIHGYEVNAFRYIVKNQPKYIYEKQFTSIFNEYSQRYKPFKISDRNKTLILSLKDICYFEVANKTISIHTINSCYQYNTTLSKVEAELKNDNFIKSHKSYFINIAQIDTIHTNDILMKNNKKIPLSRGNKKIVIQSYISYMSGR